MTFDDLLEFLGEQSGKLVSAEVVIPASFHLVVARLNGHVGSVTGRHESVCRVVCEGAGDLLLYRDQFVSAAVAAHQDVIDTPDRFWSLVIEMEGWRVDLTLSGNIPEDAELRDWFTLPG